MKFRLSQLNKLLFPEMITRFPKSENKIYLTFDDGPTPGITNRVLAFLSEYNAKATFFCRGDNVHSNKELFKSISEQGHTLGNHGYSHLHGWYTRTGKYVTDCRKAAELIPNRIFRPPYGKITPAQYQALKKDFTIYLWTALSWDFHPWINPKMCYWYSARNMFPGSILVFHDTKKASAKLFYTLPRLLKMGLEKGYEFIGMPAVETIE